MVNEIRQGHSRTPEIPVKTAKKEPTYETDICKDKLLADMRKAGVDKNNFEQVTSFLAKGTPQEVLAKLRTYNHVFFTQKEDLSRVNDAREMFDRKVGICKDFAKWNSWVLRKAGISHKVFEIMTGDLGELALVAIPFANKEFPSGHIFITVEDKGRIYKADNWGVYYLGDTKTLSDNDIVDLMAFKMKMKRKMAIFDLNTKKDYYSLLQMDKTRVNMSGRQYWTFAGYYSVDKFAQIGTFKTFENKGSTIKENDYTTKVDKKMTPFDQNTSAIMDTMYNNPVLSVLKDFMDWCMKIPDLPR
jgi:hypothetical protein